MNQKSELKNQDWVFELSKAVIGNLVGFISKEAECHASADTHLNQAIFAVMKHMREDKLSRVASARGQAYYAFKECSTYATPCLGETMNASIRIRQFYEEKLQTKLEPEQDFLYHEGDRPWGIGYFKHPVNKPSEFYIKQIKMFNDKCYSLGEILSHSCFFSFHYNFTNPTRPPFYIQSTANVSI